MLLDRFAVTRILSGAGCVAPREEADELLQAAAGDPDVLADLVSRRTNGEPIAWLTGAVEFCGHKLFVAPGVYVPRWQTEPLARRAVSLLPPAGVAADLCTGVGAIAAVLAAAVPTARVVATELDHNAAQCARRNGVEVFEGFLDDPLPREFERRVDVLTAAPARLRVALLADHVAARFHERGHADELDGRRGAADVDRVAARPRPDVPQGLVPGTGGRGIRLVRQALR
jgi:HemK-like putative methylase